MPYTAAAGAAAPDGGGSGSCTFCPAPHRSGAGRRAGKADNRGAAYAEVNEMVRTAKVTPEQLAALLRQSATATPTPAALSAVGATFEKEVDADED